MLIKINWNPDRKQLRNFGLVMWVGSTVIAGLIAWRHHAPSPATTVGIGLGIGLAIFLLSVLVRPAGLLLYRIWMGIGFILGTLIGPAFLGIVYYGFFTPIGLVMRVLKRDPLRLRKPAGDSFWTPIKHRDDPKSYERQF